MSIASSVGISGGRRTFKKGGASPETMPSWQHLSAQRLDELPTAKRS
jgi:hypothetical protein